MYPPSSKSFENVCCIKNSRTEIHIFLIFISKSNSSMYFFFQTDLWVHHGNHQPFYHEDYLVPDISTYPPFYHGNTHSTHFCNSHYWISSNSTKQPITDISCSISVTVFLFFENWSLVSKRCTKSQFILGRFLVFFISQNTLYYIPGSCEHLLRFSNFFLFLAKNPHHFW